MTLVNLCYLVKCDPDAKLTEEEFMVIAHGIMGGGGDLDILDVSGHSDNDLEMLKNPSEFKAGRKDTDSDSIKIKFISSIYYWVNQNKHIKKNETTIQQFFNLYQVMARLNAARFDYDFGLVSRFKNFLLDITNKNKKAFLVKFDVGRIHAD